MNPLVRLAFLAFVWPLWFLPFLLARRKKTPSAVQLERGARWGMLLAAAAFWITFAHGPEVWRSKFPVWRMAFAGLFAAMAIVLSWTAVRNLGKQWRIDAGLNADHELVRNGPYRFVRHPIYASMLAMLLTGILAVGTLPGWPIALVLFIAGTEIRIRIEDQLLRGRFGAEFEAWKRAVPAYLPFVR